MTDHLSFSYDNEAKTVTLPAGNYVVGDPSLSIPIDAWQPWVDACYEVGQQTGIDTGRIMVAEIGGRPAIGILPACGNGRFDSNKGISFDVDSAMIGLVQIATADRNRQTVVNFDQPVVCSYDDVQGVIDLGGILISTDLQDWFECSDCAVEVGRNEGRCADCQEHYDDLGDA